MESELGGWLSGLVIEASVLGIQTIQTYTYFTNYPHDRHSTKAIVVLLLLIQYFSLSCFASSMYRFLVTSLTLPVKSRLFALSHATWQFNMFLADIVVSSVIVQSFFVRRIFDMSRSLLWSIPLGILVLTDMVFGIIVVVRANIYTDFTVIATINSKFVLSWGVLSVAADVLISISMVILLNQRRTGFGNTDTLIDRLVLYSVATGASTSVIAIFLASFFAARGFDFSTNLFMIPMGGLYPVAMLANLHTRRGLSRIARSNGLETDIAMLTSQAPQTSGTTGRTDTTGTTFEPKNLSSIPEEPPTVSFAPGTSRHTANLSPR